MSGKITRVMRVLHVRNSPCLAILLKSSRLYANCKQAPQSSDTFFVQLDGSARIHMLLAMTYSPRYALFFAVILLMLSSLTVRNRALAADPNPREDLTGTINAMIADLKAPAPDYKKFIITYCNPEDLDEELADSKKLAETAAGFSGKIAATLLKVLEHIKNKKPLESTDTTAIFNIKAVADAEELPEDTAKFVKIKGLWYLKN